MGGTNAARLRCSAVKYFVETYRCSPMSTRALDTILRSSAKCSGVLGPDFVNVVLGVVIESYQHAFVLAYYCNECVAFIRNISVSVVLDYVHRYQAVAISRRIYNGSAVRMVPTWSNCMLE